VIAVLACFRGLRHYFALRGNKQRDLCLSIWYANRLGLLKPSHGGPAPMPFAEWGRTMKFRKVPIAIVASVLLTVGITAPANAAGTKNVQLVCGGNQVEHRMYSGGASAYTKRMSAWSCGGEVWVDARYHRGNPSVTYTTGWKKNAGNAYVEPGNVISAKHEVWSNSGTRLAQRNT